ncbi:uncharacterized protein HD556DRAFT_1314614 [Suillus plorans]|uniref:Uncharacterized protein n=1 Tax=Suillus plorans TaxID=116603 RepID=A0A9P7D9C4_9AGAM|nr:uncharacterized protein HD556DRAFT_1314614 [Suillus plorans]KAG1785010.1 hypothetical protein HD556DRAFT_1314614 [Suillus plorans]
MAVMQDKNTDPHKYKLDTSQNDQDEVGLICSICVKERSSAKRKEIYKTIQTKAGVSSPTQLLQQEECNLTKRSKIDRMQLSPVEWTRAGQFTDLLLYADVAQQAFSSDHGSTLHLAIPALETLHRSWMSQAERSKYS